MAKQALKFSMEKPAAAPKQAADNGLKFISARIPMSLFRELRVYAGHTDAKLQDVITNAISEYMTNHPA